jgi:hypothetical protein
VQRSTARAASSKQRAEAAGDRVGDRDNDGGLQMFKRAALLSVLTLFAVLAAGAAAASPALAAINVSPSPSALEYGEVDLHYGGSPQQTVTLSQIAPGEPTTVVESVNIAGAEASSFQVTSDGCSGAELENGKSCSVEVAFHSGSAPGAHTATLELLTGEGLVEVPISGSAITGTLSASPSPLSFSPLPYTAPGSHNEGEYNETESLNIDNSSNASTQVLSSSITGPDASSYSIQWNCNGNTIGTSGSCTMGVRFQPTSPGPKEASLEIVSDSQSSPLVVPLQGEGLHGPHMTLNATQALLGAVPLGSSLEQTFEVSNSGDYPLFVQRAFLVTGTPLMFPVLQDGCSGAILYPSESCSIVVAFQPTTLGEKSAALLFITNTPAINVAGIDGIGASAEPAVLTIPSTPHPHAASPAVAAATTTAPAPLEPSLSSSSHPAPAPAPALLALRLPRLMHLLSRPVLDLGADVQCPAASRGCQSLSYVLTDRSAHGSAKARRHHSPTLLGSSIGQLRPGKAAPVRIPLNRRAIARLRRNGQLDVRVGVIVQSSGEIVARHSWTVKLTPAGAVWRAG